MVNIWQNYEHEFVPSVFLAHPVCLQDDASGVSAGDRDAFLPTDNVYNLQALYSMTHLDGAVDIASTTQPSRY